MAGGMPPGGDPMAGGMGGDPAMGGGAPPSQEDLMMLMEALAQAGIPPEAFQALVAQKAASALKGQAMRPGQWKAKNAAEKQQFAQVLDYVKELAGS